MSSQLTNVRYGYFDALRGLTMILVVFSHICLFSIGYCPTVNLFFCTFRMPLFFFVSGFFAYKAVEAWNSYKVKDILSRKLKVQIFGASFFCLIFSILKTGTYPDIDSIIYATNEYWFTFILFRLFLIYMAFVLISRRFSTRKILWPTILCFSIFCIVFNETYWSFQPKLPGFIDDIIDFIIPRTFYYFPYFALGLFARSQLGNFERILSNDYIKAGLLLLVLGTWCLIYLGFIPQIKVTISFGFESPLAYPLGICTLLLIIQFFYTNRFNLDKETRFNRALKFIGRRTLDIYFLHYFFLPNLKFLEPYFQSYNSLSAQLIVGFTATLIVVALALLMGQIIRISPTLAEWLLGVKRKIGSSID